nr:unnamed protein product [Spirometra erinaceieuropaei]
MCQRAAVRDQLGGEERQEFENYVQSISEKRGEIKRASFLRSIHEGKPQSKIPEDLSRSLLISATSTDRGLRLLFSPGIDLVKMYADQLRVSYLCNDDLSELQTHCDVSKSRMQKDSVIDEESGPDADGRARSSGGEERH